MKYRMLTREELEIFEEDLKQFLIVNGVHNEEWVEMNEKDVEKATRLVELFSDTVLQKVYEKIKYLEHRSKSACLAFQLADDRVELISIVAREDGDVDLSTPESIHHALMNSPKSLTIFKTDKPYPNNREMEIHQMLEQGCLNSDGVFWEALEQVIEG